MDIANKLEPNDAYLVGLISERFYRSLLNFQQHSSELHLAMERLSEQLTILHIGSHPMDLKALLTSEPKDFVHDILGIQNHFNPQTGELDNFFLPKFGRTVKAQSC